jgi:hypothetical protein
VAERAGRSVRPRRLPSVRRPVVTRTVARPRRRNRRRAGARLGAYADGASTSPRPTACSSLAIAGREGPDRLRHRYPGPTW